MKKLSLGYFGSNDFSADFLEKILTDKDLLQLVKVEFVVTQPDRKAGRKQTLTPTPVKHIAKKFDLEILELNDLENENLKTKVSPLDLALVYSYSSIIPTSLLNLPRLGFWGIHPSLLPKYRGTSPMATALINGDHETGITIIKMDDQLDHGPIIDQQSLTIQNSDKRPDLEKKLTNFAFEMFIKLLKKGVERLGIPTARSDFSSPPLVASTDGKKRETLTSGNKNLEVKPLPKEQDHKNATYTKKLTKQDGFIEFDQLKKSIRHEQLPVSDLILFNLFRGLYPWPGIWTILPSGKRLKIIDMELKQDRIIVKKVQLEGKKEVDFVTFNQAYRIF
ncbi:methionyl-tRNA formyltransferase [Patescibacteria group bacterium]|nr:methionyl-tRNA formyltransferase [Patescibacteria group bacterium]